LGVASDCPSDLRIPQHPDLHGGDLEVVGQDKQGLPDQIWGLWLDPPDSLGVLDGHGRDGRDPKTAMGRDRLQVRRNARSGRRIKPCNR
jgi:hypothetical protein